MTNSEKNNSSFIKEQEGNRKKEPEKKMILFTFLDLLADLSMVNRNIVVCF